MLSNGCPPPVVPVTPPPGNEWSCGGICDVVRVRVGDPVAAPSVCGVRPGPVPAPMVALPSRLGRLKVVLPVPP